MRPIRILTAARRGAIESGLTAAAPRRQLSSETSDGAQGRGHGARLWRHRGEHWPGAGGRRVERHRCRGCRGRGSVLQCPAVLCHLPSPRRLSAFPPLIRFTFSHGSTLISLCSFLY